MSEIIPFAFNDSLVRSHIDENGNPWFIAKDVCFVLELGKYRDAISSLDDDEKGCPVVVDTLGGKQEMATISESGLYSLIFRSRKEEAKKFRKWITAEVLPALRKTGAYSIKQEQPALEEAKPRGRKKQLALPETPPYQDRALDALEGLLALKGSVFTASQKVYDVFHAPFVRLAFNSRPLAEKKEFARAMSDAIGFYFMSINTQLDTIQSLYTAFVEAEKILNIGDNNHA